MSHSPALRAAQAIALAGSGLMFYAKLSDGTLFFYINQRFAWLSLVAAILYIALAMAVIYSALRDRHTALHKPAADEAQVIWLVPSSARSRSHARVSWLAVGLLALPVALSLLAPARPLGASAVSNRGIGLTAPEQSSAARIQRPVAAPQNILDWLREFSSLGDPRALDGRAVDVTGFVYKDGRNKPDQFWVSRFVVSCCVADATAIGMLVQTSDAEKFTVDSWVRVTGKLKAGEFAGELIPIIIAERVELTQQPEHPYLYP
jgi:putative membrane protein